MLYTNLKHIESAAQFENILAENENVIIICGKMDPASVSMYRTAESLKSEFKNVCFFDMESDNPEAGVIHNLPEVQQLNNMPLMVCFKNGEVACVQAGIQTKAQVATILEHEFAATVNA
jgi:thioredoxin 1